MLLAAGKGRRLRPLTLTRPKPLLEVGGKALIVHHLEALREAGIEEVVVNLAYLGEQIIAALGNGERWGLNIQYSKEAQALETAGGIAHAAHLLGEAPFLLISADVWSDIDYRALIQRGLPVGEQAHLVLVGNPAHHPKGDYSLDADGQVSTPQSETSSYTYSGIGVIRPDAVINSAQRRLRFPLREVFSELIERRQLTGQYHSGHWTDVGTPERLQELNARLLLE